MRYDMMGSADIGIRQKTFSEMEMEMKKTLQEGRSRVELMLMFNKS